MGCEEMNTLKTTTPDGLITSKSVVFYKGGKSNFGYEVPQGYYYFDTYDECDGTCFIAVKLEHIPRKPHKAMSYFTYGVKLDMLTSLETKFGAMVEKARADLDEETLLKVVREIPNCEFKQMVFQKLNKVQKLKK